MTIEEILIDINEQPLRQSRYAQTLQTVLRAFLSKRHIIDLDMTGLEVLTLVYEHPDDQLKKQILEKKLGVIRSSDPYRNVVVFTAGLLVVLAISFAVLELNDVDLLIKYPDINPMVLLLDSGSETVQKLLDSDE